MCGSHLWQQFVFVWNSTTSLSYYTTTILCSITTMLVRSHTHSKDKVQDNLLYQRESFPGGYNWNSIWWSLFLSGLHLLSVLLLVPLLSYHPPLHLRHRSCNRVQDHHSVLGPGDGSVHSQDKERLSHQQSVSRVQSQSLQDVQSEELSWDERERER